jgi:hypothetical protein
MLVYIVKGCISAILFRHGASHSENWRGFPSCRGAAFLQSEYQYQFGVAIINKSISIPRGENNVPNHCYQARFLEDTGSLRCRRRNQLFLPSALFIRGGSDDDDVKELEHGSGDTTPHIEDHAEDFASEDSSRKTSFLSFFRPIHSTPPATVAIKKKDNTNKIPHGPTGGGYATMADSSESNQEDGEVLLMPYGFSTVGNVNVIDKKESSRLSTYPSAFAINQGHTMRSMQELLPAVGSKEEIQTNIPANCARSNSTSANGNSNATKLLLTNRTEATVFESRSKTSGIGDSDLQTENISAVNVSVDHSLDLAAKDDYTSSGYVSYLMLNFVCIDWFSHLHMVNVHNLPLSSG